MCKRARQLEKMFYFGVFAKAFRITEDLGDFCEHFHENSYFLFDFCESNDSFANTKFRQNILNILMNEN